MFTPPFRDIRKTKIHDPQSQPPASEGLGDGRHHLGGRCSLKTGGRSRLHLDGIGWHLTWLDSLFRDSVPDAPGIYMLLADKPAFFRMRTSCPDNVSGILYVGRSSSLRDRFRAACKLPKPQSSNPTLFNDLW